VRSGATWRFCSAGRTSPEAYKIVSHARNAASTLGGKKIKKGGNKDKDAGDPNRDQRNLRRCNEASVPLWIFMTITHLRAPAIFAHGPKYKVPAAPAIFSSQRNCGRDALVSVLTPSLSAPLYTDSIGGAEKLL
jgi:hypothetical protein